jgi:PAS domain S-box-containing protein
MAVALKERQPISGAEANAERPDGTRIRVLAYPTRLWGGGGGLIGAVNSLVDITDRKEADNTARRLAAIVESFDDAIVSKDLNGTIVTWNPGAERLFGYTAEVVVGRSVMILIHPDRHDEEPGILNRIRRGERIDHYETVRRRKDGILVEISVTVPPIKDADGRIIGASKIARDITERRRAENQQRLLIREMNHRIGNLFALTSAVTTLSARFAATPKDLADAVEERLTALSQAHNLTIANFDEEAKPESTTTLPNLIRTITAPYANRDCPTDIINGPDMPVRGKSAMSMALLLNEIATNGAKYGALSSAARSMSPGPCSRRNFF